MKEAYDFTDEFSQLLVWTCATNPSVYGRVGNLLDPDCFTSKSASFILRALKVIWSETGQGPDDVSFVLQQLHKDKASLGMSLDQFTACVDYLMTSKSTGAVDIVVKQASDVLSQRARDEAVEQAVLTLGEEGASTEIIAKLTAAERIGVQDTSLGIKLSANVFDQIAEMRRKDRLPTGIVELDSRIDGGVALGQLGFFIGASGDGKSMALTSCAVIGMRAKKNIACATLELSPLQQTSRLIASLTGVPTKEIELGNDRVARQRFGELMEKGKIGGYHVKEFEAKIACVTDIINWVHSIEDSTGEKVDLVTVDYADKLTDPRGSSQYEKMGYVYEGLRYFAVNDKRWLWTASQSQGRTKDTQILDLQDVSDSMEKVRVSDLIVTLNHNKEEGTVSFYVAKNRIGDAHFKVGPLPVGYAYGGIVKSCIGSDFSVNVQSDSYRNSIIGHAIARNSL